MDLKRKSFIKRVLDFAVSEFERRSQKGSSQEWTARNADPWTPPAPQPRAESSTEPQPTAAEVRPKHASGALEVVRSDRGALHVRWALEGADIDRSATLIEPGAVLCLRVVEFTPARDHVVRDVQDRPAVSASGECEIARVDGRAVVALGLRHGGRFVSITHHIV